jgi:aspartyl-tRNA(Asn)/glutamyl-tRNA(Gln) amidotransferase subunit B
MEKAKLIKGATGDWEVVIGMEVHAQVASNANCSRAPRPSSAARRTTTSRWSMPRCPGHAAGDQPGVRQPGGAHRARAEGADQPEIGVRPEELFLSRSAAGLSDQPVQAADRGRGRGHRRPARRRASLVGIERLHLEQDAGKSLHDRHRTMSYVDLNRSGVA